jgi:hypothetical protein
MLLLLYVYTVSRIGLGEGEFLVEDPSGDRMIVEAVEPGTIDILTRLHDTGESKWIGGLIETFDNQFGFRFKPDTIVVANFTAEGLQVVYYEAIRDNLTYWQGLGHVYIKGRVVRVPS